MRRIICDFLEQNHVIIDEMTVSHIVEPESLGEYVSRMRCEATFGGALEIRAFTKIFNLNVLVKSVPNNRNIEFLENENNKWIYLEWTGNHYEPIPIPTTPPPA
jgi:hypothetical protein